MNAESITKEFKREYTDDIKKTVIAFTNTDGGEIWIGVEDDGTVIGVPQPDAVILQVTNAIRDSIRPDVTTHTRCEIRPQDGRRIVVVHVQRGSACPYYLAGKGLRPEGVYVRQGASSVPATESAILKMIKDTGGDSFEVTRSLLQDLTFEQADKAFQEEDIRFGPEQKRSLGLIGQDGSFSNLGLLLSDQCIHTIKAAVFEGNNKKTFKDRAEFSGSLLKQMEDSYLYLDQFNHTRAEFTRLKRVDMRNYPPDAIREALLNTVVHRDYSYSGSTLISIFEDRIEFVSLGGLPKGISFNDLLLGVSVLRNSHLADVFYRLHLIEAYGTGVPKIMEYYHEHAMQPIIEVSDNAFKITLPNTNYNRRTESTYRYKLSDREQSFSNYRFPDKEQSLLDYLAEHRSAARKQLEDSAGFSQAMTIRLLNSLIKKGVVKKVGEGKATIYTAEKM
jgi:ATP-dependent DNA helicase RecG